MDGANKRIFVQSKLEAYFKKKEEKNLNKKRERDNVEENELNKGEDKIKKDQQEIDKLGYTLAKKKIYLLAAEEKQKNLTEYLLFKRKEFNIQLEKKEVLHMKKMADLREKDSEKWRSDLDDIEKEIKELVAEDIEEDIETQEIIEREVGKLIESKKDKIYELYENDRIVNEMKAEIKEKEKEIAEMEKEIEDISEKTKKRFEEISQRQKEENEKIEKENKENKEFKFFNYLDPFK